MNAKILILLLLGMSFLFLGCAKKAGQPETPSGAGAASGGAGANAGAGAETGAASGGAAGNATDQQLAGLFKIDTDKPISDEGLSTSTPKSGG